MNQLVLVDTFTFHVSREELMNMILYGSNIRPSDPANLLSFFEKDKRGHCIHIVLSRDTRIWSTFTVRNLPSGYSRLNRENSGLMARQGGHQSA
jgi:hypothetical protein